ncbi:hypothetical protein D3C72_1882800 [compost metagenome]
MDSRGDTGDAAHGRIRVFPVEESRGWGEMPQERLEIPAANAYLRPFRGRAEKHLSCRLVGLVHPYGARALIGQIVVNQHVSPRQQVGEHEITQRFLYRYGQAE